VALEVFADVRGFKSCSFAYPNRYELAGANEPVHAAATDTQQAAYWAIDSKGSSRSAAYSSLLRCALII
jgi:hypothetical protein